MAGADDISECDIERIRKYGYSYGIHRRLMGKVEEEFWSLAIPLRRIIESKEKLLLALTRKQLLKHLPFLNCKGSICEINGIKNVSWKD